MKKLILTLFILTELVSLSFGQNVYIDQALLFSQQNFGSTARSKAMGNAFGAIGGDFSSLSINPAGIGIYLRSELSTTIDAIGVMNTNTTYQGQSSDARSNNFSFRNFGYVYAGPVRDAGSGLISCNFGIGFNKLNNFNQTISVGKSGSPHSRMDDFASKSNGIPNSDLVDASGYNPYNNPNVPWESKLAWETYLINVANPDINGDGNQYSSFLFPKELVNQNLTVNKEGYLNEYLLSSGANFNHKLYLGLTVGLQDLYYSESATYSENGNINTTSFGSFEYSNNSSTRGYGVNFKFGAIFKPIAGLRLGAAIHTPTFFKFKETYSSVMSSDLKNVSPGSDGIHKAESPIGNNDYKFNTPMRVIGSVAYQFGKIAMLSFDYENVDYSNSRYMNTNGNDYSWDNSSIRLKYRPTSNLRFGGELKPIDVLSLRAGYELYGNPYKKSIPDPTDPTIMITQPNSDYSFKTINFGIGYRLDNVSFDVSYSLGRKTDYNYIYGNVDPVKYQRNNNELILSMIIKL